MELVCLILFLLLLIHILFGFWHPYLFYPFYWKCFFYYSCNYIHVLKYLWSTSHACYLFATAYILYIFITTLHSKNWLVNSTKFIGYIISFINNFSIQIVPEWMAKFCWWIMLHRVHIPMNIWSFDIHL